jgi:hypothetical protein
MVMMLNVILEVSWLMVSQSGGPVGPKTVFVSTFVNTALYACVTP